jgi:hypothetical protein
MLEVSQYTEVNLIGIAVLLTILIVDRKNHAAAKDDIHQNFLNMIIINAIILLLDNSIYLLRGIASAGIVGMTYIFCCVCFILHTWFGYQWLCYVIGFVYPRFQLTKIGKITDHAAFFDCKCYLSFLTPFNGWVFRFSAENVYAAADH